MAHPSGGQVGGTFDFPTGLPTPGNPQRTVIQEPISGAGAPLPVDPWAGIATLLEDVFSSELSSGSSASYLQSVQTQLNQDIFTFEKVKWADQLGQWNQQFGFSEEQFDATFGLQQEQLATSSSQFSESMLFQREQADNAWSQFLTTMDFQKSSFTEQLDVSKAQFEATMGFNFAQLEAQMGLSQDQLSLERERLSQSASNFAQQMGIESEKLGIQRESLDLQRELGRGQLDLARSAQAFEEKTISTKMLLEAAGLAASPTGAIQLAYMARASGAPAGAIASIFQNLPFVQAALQGKTLPGFGVPTQLGGGTQPSGAAYAASGGGSSSGGTNLVSAALGGGSSPSTGSGASGATGPTTGATGQFTVQLNDGRTFSYATEEAAQNFIKNNPGVVSGGIGSGGGTSGAASASTGGGTPSSGALPSKLGIELPALTALTQQQYAGMTDQEKLFLGALYQSETGEPIDQVLSKIQKSFIPTADVSAIGI